MVVAFLHLGVTILILNMSQRRNMVLFRRPEDPWKEGPILPPMLQSLEKISKDKKGGIFNMVKLGLSSNNS